MKKYTYNPKEDIFFRVPKYIQLKQIIKEGIHNKGLKPGDKLPSEKELMRRYNLNQSIVTQAFRELVAEGVVDRVQGKGTFVANPESLPGENLVGVVVPDLTDYIIYGEMTRAIEDKCREYGYHIIACSTDYEVDREVRLIKELVNKVKIRGLISRPSKKEKARRLYKRLRNSGFPLVLLAPIEGIEDISYVRGDAIWIGYIAIKHLLKLGHQRIAIIGFSRKSLEGRQIILGANKAFKEHGLAIDNSLVRSIKVKDIRIIGATNTGEVAKKLLKLNNPPTAFFGGDFAARDILAAVIDEGLKVPGDISIAGCDDSIIAKTSIVPFTSVAIPKAEIGMKAVELLMEQINRERRLPLKLELKSKLIKRESTGILKK